MNGRRFWVLLHRYTGLAMTAFLIVVGLTGSLLAFLPELDGAINPQWSTPVQIGTLLESVLLMENAERSDTIKADALWLSDTTVTVTVSSRAAVRWHWLRNSFAGFVILIASHYKP